MDHLTNLSKHQDFLVDLKLELEADLKNAQEQHKFYKNLWHEGSEVREARYEELALRYQCLTGQLTHYLAVIQHFQNTQCLQF